MGIFLLKKCENLVILECVIFYGLIWGEVWNGLIRYYWVIWRYKDDNNKTTGYIATRKVVSKQEVLEHEKIYEKMLQIQK